MYWKGESDKKDLIFFPSSSSSSPHHKASCLMMGSLIHHYFRTQVWFLCWKALLCPRPPPFSVLLLNTKQEEPEIRSPPAFRVNYMHLPQAFFEWHTKVNITQPVFRREQKLKQWRLCSGPVASIWVIGFLGLMSAVVPTERLIERYI